MFWSAGRLGRAVSWTSLATFALSLLSLIGISLAYGVNREYRFEIAVISFAWLGSIAVLIYRRTLSKSPEIPRVPAESA